MQQFKCVKPNLPSNDVTCVAINYKASKAIECLDNKGIQAVRITPNNNISTSVSSHADIRLCHYSENELYFDNEILAGELPDFFEKRIIGGLLSTDYPNDVKLNCVRIDNKLICNKKTVAPEILLQAEKDNLIIIDTRQGYTKCSVCVVDNNCIITDDESIYKSTQNFFDDVILISKGSVLLEGMNYGFIGGATGKLSDKIIAFNGRIESHTDHNIIIDTLYKHNIAAVELTPDKLEDIGSIIPLLQK